jgi:hypothetical protein
VQKRLNISILIDNTLITHKGSPPAKKYCLHHRMHVEAIGQKKFDHPEGME